MRSRVSVVKWPLRHMYSGRQISITARSSQASDGGLEINPKPVQTCPVQGTRARSTHAAIDTSMFDVAPSVKSWEDVPGPRPLPLLGNTWRFTPYIGKCIHSREIDACRV
ncbi:hypothetical protein PYW07_006327 [Mythimna separata]|uniref:Uncharacterized protein n=1 Tax=Mythimna separata TaxID=271217 RepID=A0AAD8DXD0_MYTSE|nr:hypothetical protein PYW07_006327 [Mythimna separata]